MGTALPVIQMHPPHRHPILLLLNRCKTLKHLRCIHAKLTILGPAFLHPSPTFTKLLYTFTFLHPLPPTHSIDYALSLFHRIPSPSTFAYNLLIRARTLLSSPFQALILFARMRRLSIPPDYHSFPFALKACACLRSLPLGRALHSQALKLGFATDLFVHNTLISMYASSDSMLDARSLFDEISSCDVVTYNTLIDGYVKAGDMILARKLFDEMPHRDTVSWGTLLAGYSQMSQFKEALQLFDRMLPTGSRPDDVALVSALSCCAQLGALDQGKVIHQYIKENRAALNVYLLTGLVDMYAKCGCIDAATEMFESAPHRNLFTWNAIVVGLAMHGHGERSLRYFERMIGVGVRPDGVSFLGVLVACSHAGLTDTARKLFDEMESIFGVARELKHYGCMADLLGRAGLMEKAMDMIKAMPMEADAYVWGGVLGGCRIHGNVEIAEIATEHLLRLNPEDSGVYSIMAGIYANARRWEDVARMRRLMEDKRVRKNVGRSLIEVEGTNHGFVADLNTCWVNGMEMQELQLIGG